MRFSFQLMYKTLPTCFKISQATEKMANYTLKAFKMFKTSKIRQSLKILRTTLWCPRRFSSRYGGNIEPLPTRYGGITNVTILPGVGIGPEIMESTLQVLTAAEAPLSFEILTLSPEENLMEEFENALTSIRRNKVALKGNIEIKSKDPYVSSRNITLRKTLDLYVYAFFCKTYPGLANKFGEIDIIVIRQNTEGEYLMLEHEPYPGSVESLKVVSKFNSERIAEFAFKYALENKRKRITVVHNADVQIYAEGLFVKAATKVSEKYPSIKMNVLEVGVAVVEISKNPKHFDIILATNLNGSMVSNFLSGMMGGPGLSAGTNFSESGIAVFEPGARNKGSSIVGQGIANPVAMIMAGINMLDYLGYNKTADTVRKSVFATLVYDKIQTQDLGGKATTKAITENVIRHVRARLKPKTSKKVHAFRNRWKIYCPVPEGSPSKN